jgi:hypothetical protein
MSGVYYDLLDPNPLLANLFMIKGHGCFIGPPIQDKHFYFWGKCVQPLPPFGPKLEI